MRPPPLVQFGGTFATILTAAEDFFSCPSSCLPKNYQPPKTNAFAPPPPLCRKRRNAVEALDATYISTAEASHKNFLRHF